MRLTSGLGAGVGAEALLGEMAGGAVGIEAFCGSWADVVAGVLGLGVEEIEPGMEREALGGGGREVAEERGIRGKGDGPGVFVGNAAGGS